MECSLVWWTASVSKARNGVCRSAGGRTSSWGLSLEEWGAVKSLLAVGQHVHPTLAAGEMLGGQRSCRTDSLQTGIGKVSPAHRAKVPLWLDFQTAQNRMPQLVQLCCNTACTTTGICQCYPLDPACPECPSLQAWPQGWGCQGSLVKTISLCACKCFNATCTPAWWEINFVLLGCMESSGNSVAGGERGATAKPCPSLFPPQKLPDADTHWYFTAHAPAQPSKCQDAFFLQTHDDK